MSTGDYSAHTQDVIEHYRRRHTVRGDLFGEQPFANYGYWTRDGMTIEQAAEALTQLVASSAGLGPGDRVLDVGCGYGAGAVSYMRRCQPDAIVGIDVTDIRIDEGQRYVARHGFAERIELQLGDATKMAFADASFDKVVSVECAFHFDTRRDFLREAARVLVPGGTLTLTDMIPRRGVDPRAYLRGRPIPNGGICLDNLANAYDADVYAGHLREAGFTHIRIESIIDWTRMRFVDALQALASAVVGERQEQLRRAVANLRHHIDCGEDYVLVVARRGR
ncbi:class I SAM-dependent methyltransferase [Solimonas marina]|uniref:Methyltransferase domain-containing protein n=1 Tax=Solimonas marina TaxID=2714601 RepID=A0A969W6D3_9GAMM|nr:class I SAM-dependent methyltransferase [Solimonas marina]NKF21407.1 methyltransferase domain-containing protein [Solimonas marina]